MGFLDRLNGVLQNNNNGVRENSNKAHFLGIDFNRNSLAKHNLAQDSFSYSKDSYTTPVVISNEELALKQPVQFIKKYLNNKTIDKAIAQNPNIEKILKENGLKLEYDINNVSTIIMSHLIPTSKTAQKLYLKMGHNNYEKNYSYLTQAALLHDIGKCFIPKEILNKKGKLTPKERSIVQLHNLLSYEILRTTDLNPKVAQLAFEHHDYNKRINRTQENQALTISDVYCALKEDRPYKKPLSDICAKMVLYDMGTKGSFDTRYVNYLCT